MNFLYIYYRCYILYSYTLYTLLLLPCCNYLVIDSYNWVPRDLYFHGKMGIPIPILP